MVVNIKRRVCQVVHSLHISRFMETKAQLSCHKEVIFIGMASGGLIILRGVLVVSSSFYFQLRAMFNSSLGGRTQKSFQKVNFLISLPVLVIFFSC